MYIQYVINNLKVFGYVLTDHVCTAVIFDGFAFKGSIPSVGVEDRDTSSIGNDDLEEEDYA